MKTLHLAMLGNRAHCWKSLVCVPRCKRPLGHVGYKKPHLGIQTGKLCHGFCNFPRPSWWKGRHSTSVDSLRGGLKRRSNRMFFLCHVSIDSVRLLSLLVQQKSQLLQSFQAEMIPSYLYRLHWICLLFIFLHLSLESSRLLLPWPSVRGCHYHQTLCNTVFWAPSFCRVIHVSMIWWNLPRFWVTLRVS